MENSIDTQRIPRHTLSYDHGSLGFLVLGFGLLRDDMIFIYGIRLPSSDSY